MADTVDGILSDFQETLFEQGLATRKRLEAAGQTLEEAFRALAEMHEAEGRAYRGFLDETVATPRRTAEEKARIENQTDLGFDVPE